MANIHPALQKLISDDPNSKQKGNRFERFIQKVLLEHPGVYGKERFKDVWLWSEWQGKEDTGLEEVNGIDIVAQQTDAWGGGLCAIQCKFWNKNSKIGKGEVAKFVVDVNRSKTEFASVLFITTSSLTESANNVLLDNTPAGHVLQTSVMEDWVADWNDWVDDFSNLKIEAVEGYDERDYQREAREAAIASFESGENRGQIILPCGTGKMFVSLKTAEQIAGKGKTVLYLVPSLGLVQQTMQEWSEQRTIPLQYMAVCSDTSVAKDKNADPDVAGYMAEMAMPVTTCPQKIKKHLEAPASSEAMRVVFSTYQSSPQIKEALEDSTFEFDLMILDEAHRTSGRDRSEDSPFIVPLHDHLIPASYRLFFTATPRVFADDKKAVEDDLSDQPDSYDMADEAVYGKVLYNMKFSEAIEAGWLCDYEVLVVTGSRAAFRDSLPIEDGVVVWNEKDVAMDDLIRLVGAWDALASPDSEGWEDGKPTGATEAGHLKSAIAYLNRTKDAKWVADEWDAINSKVEAVQNCWGASTVSRLKLNVETVNAKTPAVERSVAVNSLKNSDSLGECNIVSNVKVFSEGVNVPNLDAVIFLDARSSAVDIAQQIGRVMRTADGKQKGYIILPVFVPDEAAPDEWLKSSDWKKLWRVIKALRSHDERLEQYLAHPKVFAEKSNIKVFPTRTGKQDSGSEEAEEDTVDKVKKSYTGKLFYEDLKQEIASKAVKLCGDKQAYPGWGRHAAKVSANIASKLEAIVELPCYKSKIDKFVEELQKTVSADIFKQQAIEMLAQHSVTIPIFDRMLGNQEFAQQNPVSKSICEVLTRLGKDPHDPFPEETRLLQRAYDSMGRAFDGAVSDAERLDVLKSIYDGFFAEAMPNTVEELGIVYTPVELVDFVIRSCAKICQNEFGLNIGDENVHVIDPFSGTGTFLARLISGTDENGNPYIPDADLQRKYRKELHGNEIVLLAYYVAALTIEASMHARDVSANYENFDGMTYSDTFEDFPAQGSLWGTSDRRARQDALPMYVVMGNPPWSGGAKKAGDGFKKKQNPKIAKRIKETYVAKLKKLTGRDAMKAAGNLYVQAFRWASDRIVRLPENMAGKDYPSVVAYVSPNSLTTGTSLAGMRASLREEFTDIFVVNLRGDAMKAGEVQRKEGDKVFGIGSRSGVQITFLVRNPSRDLSSPASLKYIEVPDYMSLEDKFQWLKALGDVYSPDFKDIPVAPDHDWVVLPDPDYDAMLPAVGFSKVEDENTFCTSSALGVTAACDIWAYSYSREDLASKMRTLISRYQNALWDVKTDFPNSKPTDKEIAQIMEDNGIARVAKLSGALKQRKDIQFEASRMREALYRPFTKLWLYEDDRILASVNTIAAMFPRDEEVEAVGFTSGSSRGETDSIFATDSLSDLNNLRGGFPDCRQEAILTTSGSNMIFQPLAANKLPDLATIQGSQQTRVIPRVK